MKNKFLSVNASIAATAIASLAVIASFSATPATAASYLPDYMIIATSTKDGEKAFLMSNSEIGAIGVNGSTSPPGSVPSAPAGSRGPTAGISLDGDVAITNPNTMMTFSNSDVHSANTGPANAGAQGIDCAGSYNSCTDNGSQISSSNQYNTSAPAASFTALGNNNGVQGGVDHTDLLAEAGTLTHDYWNLASTEVIPTFNFDTIQNTNLTSNFGSGLNVIDLGTGSNDFLLENGTWTISGDEDTFVIFRVQGNNAFNISEANLFLGGDIGVNNVLFLVDADKGVESFNFDNVYFNGMSFWDHGGEPENTASFNNVQGCGQIMTNIVNFQNVSMSGCSFDYEEPTLPSVVPLPAALPLFGAALGIFGYLGRRKRKQS